MEQLLNEKIEKSELLERAEKLKAMFPNTQAALTFFSKEIEKLSEKYKVTVSDLILKAEHGPMNDDFSYALSLARKIQILR